MIDQRAGAPAPRRVLPFAPEGLPIIGGGLAALVALTAISRKLFWPLLALNAFSLYFFRDPEREIPRDTNVLTSPADGKVVGVDVIADERFPGGQAKRVSIFLSLFNVHVQRAPMAGRVIAQHYNPGEFKMAFHEKASELNEQMATVIVNDRLTLKVTQIAGYVARRIISYVRPGDAVGHGDRIGIIKFGSRVDVAMPLAVAVRVGVGDRVVAGETVIGRLS